MEIIKAHSVADGPNPHGVSAKPLHDSEHVQVVMVTLEGGEALKWHITPVDVFFYVLEGEGIVEIGDDREMISEDDLVLSPRGIRHRLLNDGDETFRFLVVKTPRPSTSTKIL